MGIEKPLKPIDQTSRDILRENVLALREAHHPGMSDREWYSRVRVARSTMRHVMDADSGASVDTIAAIARAYHLDPWQLLVPGLDPASPPALLAQSAGPPPASAVRQPEIAGAKPARRGRLTEKA